MSSDANADVQNPTSALTSFIYRDDVETAFKFFLICDFTKHMMDCFPVVKNLNLDLPSQVKNYNVILLLSLCEIKLKITAKCIN